MQSRSIDRAKQESDCNRFKSVIYELIIDGNKLFESTGSFSAGQARNPSSRNTWFLLPSYFGQFCILLSFARRSKEKIVRENREAFFFLFDSKFFFSLVLLHFTFDFRALNTSKHKSNLGRLSCVGENGNRGDKWRHLRHLRRFPRLLSSSVRAVRWRGHIWLLPLDVTQSYNFAHDLFTSFSRAMMKDSERDSPQPTHTCDFESYF